MNDYPNLSTFHNAITAQHAGIAGATVFTVIVLLYLHYLITRYPSAVKFTLTASYYAIFALSQITIMPAIFAIAYATQKVRDGKWVIFALVALAVGVRLVHINDSYWYDEAFTAVLSQHALTPDFGTIIASDVHPPYFYILSAMVNPRVISFVAGLCVVFYSNFLAYEWSLSRKSRLLIMFLLAILPAQVYYSNEARAYMLIVLAVLTALTAIETDKPLVAGASIVLLGMLHHIAHLYAFMLCVLVLYRYRFSKRWLAVLSVVALTTISAIPLILSQSRDIADGFWLPAFHISMIATPLLSMTTGLALPPYAPWLAFIPIAMTLTSAVWVYKTWLPLYRLSWFLIVLGVPALLALASTISNVYLDRALLPSATLIIFAWGDMLANTSNGYNKIARFVAINAIVFLSAYALINTQRIDNRSIVSACGDKQIVTTTISTAIVASAYADNVLVWRDANDLNQTLTNRAKRLLFTLDDLADLPESFCLLNGYNALNRQTERDLVAKIIDSHDLVSVSHIKNDVYTLEARVLNGRK